MTPTKLSAGGLSGCHRVINGDMRHTLLHKSRRWFIYSTEGLLSGTPSYDGCWPVSDLRRAVAN